MARKQKSSKPERQQAILAQLRATPAIRINELAASFAVSTETIRRDLDEMSSAGLISRTYGGATGTLQLSEPPLSDRYGINESERNAMASAVAALVEDGDSLMIDSGSTTIFVARRLAADRNGLTVVTNSIGVTSALASNPTIRVRLCPGDYDRNDGGVSGPDTVQYLGQFHVRHCIVSASRLDTSGPSDLNPATVWVKRKMIESAENSILVLDHTKFGGAAFERICPLDEIDWLVTDRPPPDGLNPAIIAAGIRVEIAR